MLRRIAAFLIAFTLMLGVLGTKRALSADYSQQIDDLKAAADICQKHVITTSINGVTSEYPRWPQAWAACEVVWRNWLDMQTMKESDVDDRGFVNFEASKLR